MDDQDNLPEEGPIFYQPLSPDQMPKQAVPSVAPTPDSAPQKQPDESDVGADPEMVRRLVQFHASQIGTAKAAPPPGGGKAVGTTATHAAYEREGTLHSYSGMCALVCD